MARLTADKPFLHEDVTVHDVTYGGFVEIGRGTRMSNVVMGDYSYCDRYCDIANARIGKFSNIASFVRIGATDHPMEKASLHHFHYRSDDYWDDVAADLDWFAHRASRLAEFGHDTWIGHNAQIKPEVTLGHGAVVASGAVVTTDVAPYTIVAGIPARPVRDRLDAETADRMTKLAWWNWDHDTLRSRLKDFRSMTAAAFLDKYEA
ncbi:chloramphenicol acetyltransferase [Litoreibacter roseus]|uniref:Acetyltransferase n=1 Tax=Litoreibacter roseus TaxID=2601869 RepID=A0A6N6JIC9_9RHOB|nr:chloramphenicol acetyltransferase [Litoreibacter roseus]GFE66123.1 acetyltransferase [Litoreibacter roseus]